MSRKPRDAKNRTHYFAFLGALLLCLGAVAWMIAPYFLALLLGGLLALLASPLQRRFARAMKPTTAAIACTVLLLVLIIGPAAAFSVAVVRQAVAVGRELAEREGPPPVLLSRWLTSLPAVRVFGPPQQAAKRVQEAVRAVGVYASGKALKFAAGIPLLLLQLGLSLVAFFFILRDGRRFVEFALSRGVLDRDVQEKLARTFSETALSTVLAGLAAATIQGVLICVGYLLLGVPGAFVAGGATFILAWLPMVGSLPASGAAVAYLYLEGEPLKAGLMLAVALAAGVSDNVVRPLVLKGRADLHPLIGLVAIVAGIDMFGILGLFIGPLLVAIACALLETWPDVAERRNAQA